MNEPHAFTGLFAGDHFIHEFTISGHALYASGVVRTIDADGHYHSDYQSRQPPSKTIELEPESHRVLARINKKAYELARLRRWPNTASEVTAIVDYSAGKPVRLSVAERLRLLLIN